MSDQPPPLTLDQLYGAWNTVPPEFWEALDQSHSPRSREMLYDKMESLGCGDAHRVLDVGCWDAKHACELARRFGCRVMAVDYFDSHIEQANRVIEKQELAGLVTAAQGDIQSLKFDEGVFDFIWCRDMLPHVRDIRKALSECSRVLKPGGKMVIDTDVETDLMEPREAARLYGDAMHRNSVSRDSIEDAFEKAGLRVLERDEVGTEWFEWDEEHPNKKGSIIAEEFLRIARMVRSKEALIAQFGRTIYEAELTGSLWYAYEILGKLMPTVYVVSKTL